MFEWDAHNRAHVAQHGVKPQEAEQVIQNHPVDLEYTLRNEEHRIVSVGETDRGRVLVVVTTQREHKIRVVTAYPAKKRLRDFYSRHK